MNDTYNFLVIKNVINEVVEADVSAVLGLAFLDVDVPRSMLVLDVEESN